jgi:hypothetical protein
MKDYAEIYVSLREEIIQKIDEKVDDILAKHDVELLSELECPPILCGYVTEWVDCDDSESDWVLTRLTITDIYVGGEFTAHNYHGDEASADEYGLYELTTDSLIDIYNELCKL